MDIQVTYCDFVLLSASRRHSRHVMIMKRSNCFSIRVALGNSFDIDNVNKVDSLSSD
jgi:hypothetical protein